MEGPRSHSEEQFQDRHGTDEAMERGPVGLPVEDADGAIQDGVELPRRSQRERRAPIWMADYDTEAVDDERGDVSGSDVDSAAGEEAAVLRRSARERRPPACEWIA